VGFSESKVPYVIVAKPLDIIRRLFIQLSYYLLPFTIFPHNHLLCWCTCLGAGNQFLETLSIGVKLIDHATMLAPHVPLYCHATTAISYLTFLTSCVCVWIL